MSHSRTWLFAVGAAAGTAAVITHGHGLSAHRRRPASLQRARTRSTPRAPAASVRDAPPDEPDPLARPRRPRLLRRRRPAGSVCTASSLPGPDRDDPLSSPSRPPRRHAARPRLPHAPGPRQPGHARRTTARDHRRPDRATLHDSPAGMSKDEADWRSAGRLHGPGRRAGRAAPSSSSSTGTAPTRCSASRRPSRCVNADRPRRAVAGQPRPRPRAPSSPATRSSSRRGQLLRGQRRDPVAALRGDRHRLPGGGDRLRLDGEKLFPFSPGFHISDVEPGRYILMAMTDDASGGQEGFGADSDTKVITIQ